MDYQLFYWPTIQGSRGSSCGWFWRRPGARYRDVAREIVKTGPRSRKSDALMRFLEGRNIERPPFAPPFLKAGRLIIGQTANILQFLSALVTALRRKTRAAGYGTHELQLTMADFLGEIHDTHHPVAAGLYYEDQKKEARRRRGPTF